MKIFKVYTILIVVMLAGIYFAGGYLPEWPFPWVPGALIFTLIFSGSGLAVAGGGTILALFGEGLTLLPVTGLVIPFLVTTAVLAFAGRFIEFIPVSGRPVALYGFLRSAFAFLLLNIVFSIAVVISGYYGSQIVYMRDAGHIFRFTAGLMTVYTVYVLAVLPVLHKRNDT